MKQFFNINMCRHIPTIPSIDNSIFYYAIHINQNLWYLNDTVLVVDVYADWCGPCSSMSSMLKRVKLEISDDNLHLATVRY